MIKFSKISVNIDSDFILKNVSDATIFSKYFGNFEFKKVYSSPFRKDKDASTGFYVNKDNVIIFNDLKTGEKLNCFRFVAKLFNISYFEALNVIAKDFGLIKGFVPKYDKKIVFQIDKEVLNETLIQFEPNPWLKPYINYFKKINIKEEEIDKNEIFPVKKLWINKLEFAVKELMFARIQEHEGKIYTKVYAPYSKKWKWRNNFPLNLPFGINKLKFTSDTLLIGKSFKEETLLKTFHTDVIATQNESEASFSLETMKIIEPYKRKILVWDADPAGIENASKLIKKGFESFTIPIEDYEMFGITDTAEYSEWYGKDELIKLFTEKNII